MITTARAACRAAIVTAAVAIGVLRCASRDEPPDVLVLVMDTTRADRCSLTGYDRPTTPRLDALAKESVVFDDAWSPSSWTFPAHAAMFTGRSPESLGIVSADRGELPRTATTLAEILGAAGWATGCFTCNLWIAPHSGLSRGFAHVEPFSPLSPKSNAREAHARALDWMRARRREGRRFFAFVNDIEPHAPWSPPEEFARRLVDPAHPRDVVDAAAALRPPRTVHVSLGIETVAPGVLEAASDLYDAEVAGLDADVGSLLDAMRAEGLLDRTLVVVASDHGEGLGDHGWLEHMIDLHREVLRVPILVRPPGGCAPRRVTTPVVLHDVFATVLEACGVPRPDGTESRSLLTDASPRVPRAAEDARYPFFAALRDRAPAAVDRFARVRRSIYDGRWHLIVDDRGGAELYDVAADPAEKNDVAASQPDVVAGLRAQLGAAPR